MSQLGIEAFDLTLLLEHLSAELFNCFLEFLSQLNTVVPQFVFEQHSEHPVGQPTPKRIGSL